MIGWVLLGKHTVLVIYVCFIVMGPRHLELDVWQYLLVYIFFILFAVVSTFQIVDQLNGACFNLKVTVTSCECGVQEVFTSQLGVSATSEHKSRFLWVYKVLFRKLCSLSLWRLTMFIWISYQGNSRNGWCTVRKGCRILHHTQVELSVVEIRLGFLSGVGDSGHDKVPGHIVRYNEKLSLSSLPEVLLSGCHTVCRFNCGVLADICREIIFEGLYLIFQGSPIFNFLNFLELVRNY